MYTVVPHAQVLSTASFWCIKKAVEDKLLALFVDEAAANFDKSVNNAITSVGNVEATYIWAFTTW